MSALGIVAVSASYLLAGFLVACRVASLLAWHWRTAHNSKWFGSYRLQQPSSEQWFGAGCVGLLCATVWPLMCGMYLLRGFLFAPPPDVVRERQQARIAELERELEIGGER